MGLTGTNILPGLSVTVVGEAEGIRFLMTNTTDENIIVDLTVTGPNFPKDQENTAYRIYVPPARRRNPRAFPDNPQARILLVGAAPRRVQRICSTTRRT
jgi:hypothetical protein